MAEIKKSDIANKDAFDNITNGAKAAKVEVIGLEKAIIDMIKVQKKALESGSNPKTAKERKQRIKDVKKIEKTVKALNDTQKVHLQIEKDEQKALLKLKKLNSDKITDTIQINRLSAEQNKINKDAEIINAKNVGTLKKIAAQSRILRRERDGLNLNTKKGQERLKLINKELDKNNKFIEKNSDKLKKQKLNVGNYTNSIKEAAGASGLFGGVLGKLSAIQGVLNSFQKKAVVQTEVQTASTVKLTIAQKAQALATGIGTKALRIFKFALASTGIGLLVVALGAMIAFFTRSQKGIDFLAVKMAMLGAAVDVVIDAFAAFGEAIFDAFSNPKEILNDIVDFIKTIPGLVIDNIVNRFKAIGVIMRAVADGDLKAIANGFIQLGTGIEDFADKAEKAIELVGEAAEKAIKKAEELAKVMAEKARIAGILKDLTIKLTREEALASAQQAHLLTLAKEQILISKDKLKLDDVRIAALQKANDLEVEIANIQLGLAERKLAASLDGLSADEKSLENDAARLEFIKGIQEGTIGHAEAVEKAAKFTLSSAEGEKALFEIIDQIKEVEQERQNIAGVQATTLKKLSALQVQVGTKQAMAQVREAAAFRELAKVKTKSIEERSKLLEDAAQKEILSFKTQVKFNIKNAEELAAAELQIRAKLKADLLKLKDTGEVETEDDPDAAVLEQIEQIKNARKIAAAELIADNETNKELIRTTVEDEFFLRQTELRRIAQFRIDNEAETAAEILLIQEELKDELDQLEDDKQKKIEDNLKKREEQEEAARQKQITEAKRVANEIANEFTKQLKDKNKETNKALSEDIKRAQDAVNLQADIARNGGENILAEEQARLDKARLAKQRELERQRKQEQNIALATAFVNNYSTRSKTDPKTAFALALKDTLLAKGIATGLSSFFDGTEDTGKGGDLDSKGGYLAKLHPNERVMTAKQNAMVGNMSNNELAQLAYDHQTGQLFASPNGLDRLQGGSKKDNAMIQNIQSQTSELKAALQKYQSTTNINWNSLNETVEREIKKGLKTITTHKRSRL